MLSVSLNANKFTRMSQGYISWICGSRISLGCFGSIFTGTWYILSMSRFRYFLFITFFSSYIIKYFFYSIIFVLFSLFRDYNYAFLGSSLPGLYIYHFLLNLFYLQFLFYFLASSHLYPLFPCWIFYGVYCHVCSFQFVYVSVIVFICFFHFTKICKTTIHFLPASLSLSRVSVFMVHVQGELYLKILNTILRGVLGLQ